MDKFITYDKFGKRIGVKSRKDVHTKGFWHRGIQVNIYHKKEILVQRRSDKCDIAWNLYDQSLAVQALVCDKENDQNTLKRGFSNELGIDSSLLPQPKKVAGPYKLKKLYHYAPKIINNEFVTLYKIELKNKINFKKNHDKIKAVSWIKVNQLKNDVIDKPEKYTKTLAFWIKKGYI